MSLETYKRRKDGLISYSYKFKWKKQTIRGYCGPVSRTIAKRMERERRVELAEGRYREPAEPTLAPTLDAFAPAFLRWYAVRRRQSSARTYQTRLNHHLLPYLGERRLDQLTTAALEDYGTQRRQEGASARSVNGEYTVLSALLRHATDVGVLAQRPTIHWLDEAEADPRVLSPEEEGYLLKSAGTHLHHLIRFALHTGLRRDELRGLTWASIDAARREVVITSERAKSKRTRRVPLNATALGVLEEIRQAGPLRHGRLFGYKSLTNALRNACAKSGLTGVSYHTLRYTFATRALEAGVNVRTVQRWLGHRELRVTQKYLNPGERYEREAIEAITESHHVVNSPEKVRSNHEIPRKPLF